MAENGGQGRLPKVLIVDLSLSYGGSTSRVLSLLQRSAAGSIGLACLRGGSVTEHALALGFPAHVVGKGKTDPSILFNLSGLIWKENYQVLDCQNIQSKFWGSLAAMVTGASLISTIHSWYQSEHGQDSLKGRIYTGLELLTNRHLDLYITVSQNDRRALLASGVQDEDIELIYNAVDIDASTVQQDRERLQERFGLAAQAIVCTAVGRLVSAKNYETLITAVKKAIPEVPELACLIIGTGELERDLESQIKELELEKHVTLAGYLERQEVLEVIKSSDIFAMPSKYEGTPIALLEAAALGTPILTTNAGGIPELVTDREHALMVNWEDADGMAQALVRLSRDREYARALGSRAQQHVREAFGLERQIQSTWQAYEKAWRKHAAQYSRSGGG